MAMPRLAVKGQLLRPKSRNRAEVTAVIIIIVIVAIANRAGQGIDSSRSRFESGFQEAIARAFLAQPFFEPVYEPFDKAA